MINRIRQLMEYSGLSSSQFADGIEVPRAILSHIMSGRNKPSLDVILKVAAKYTDVNLEWLMLGKGEMLKKLAPDAVPDKVAKSTETPVSTVAESINKDDAKPGKVQTITQAETPIPAGAIPGKQIKQIVFFYTDNSFSVFNPEV